MLSIYVSFLFFFFFSLVALGRTTKAVFHIILHSRSMEQIGNLEDVSVVELENVTNCNI